MCERSVRDWSVGRSGVRCRGFPRRLLSTHRSETVAGDRETTQTRKESLNGGRKGCGKED